MATDTVPAAAPGSPEPAAGTTADNEPAKGLLAAMLAPVEPARPTFDLSPAPNSSTTATGPDDALDRSAPGLSSASFRDAENAAAKDATGEKRKAQGSVWKAWWLAGATRWAKGGGTANKRVDMQKAKAQAHQVKESRTTSVTNSGGLAGRNSVGAGGTSKGNSGKAGGDSHGKSPSNSSGNGSSGAGRSGSGGGRGTSGGSGGSASSGAGSGRDKKADNHNAGSSPHGSASNGKGTAGASNTGTSDKSSTGTSGKGGGDKAKSDGKDSSPKGPGSTGTGPKSAASGGDGKSGSAGKDGKPGKSGTSGASGGANGSGKQPDTRSPLEKSREIGHKDGGAVRNVIDHVKAYKDGTVDGYRDKTGENAKEHDRLDKAHTTHKKKTEKADPAKAGKTAEQEDDGVSTDVKPLTIKTIDANTLTLGTDGAKATVSRKELRNFKQYERKLEAKETVLQNIATACKQLEKQAEDEAKDCQDLVEQAKSVKGGEQVIATLNRLAETAKNQAAEAAELAQRSRRAAEMCKVVLTNIQTRYAPLYKAVVESVETKPGELRFYNDKGTYAPAA